MYHSFFIHPPTDGHWGCFQTLAIVNNAAMNIGMHLFFLISVSGFLGYITRSEIAGPKGISNFNFFEETPYYVSQWPYQSAFYQQCTNILFSTSSLVLVLFWFIDDSLIVVLICISLMISDTEHFFISLFSIYVSSLEKCLFRSFVHFLIGLSSWCVILYIFWKLTPHQMCHWQICSPIHWVPFSFCWCNLLLCSF